MAARRSSSPVNGSHEFALAVASAALVAVIASGGSGRSVSRFSRRSTGQRVVTCSASRATRSMPKPCTADIRSAGLMDMAVYYIGQMDETPASRIATNLRALRAARAMSTLTLAKRSGVARATLTKIEAGDGNPTIDTLYAVADALGVPLGDLIGEPPAATRVVVVPAGVGATVRGAVSPRLLDRVPGHGVTEVYEISFSTKQRTA